VSFKDLIYRMKLIMIVSYVHGIMDGELLSAKQKFAHLFKEWEVVSLI
jgi:hypothetical protein